MSQHVSPLLISKLKNRDTLSSLSLPSSSTQASGLITNRYWAFIIFSFDMQEGKKESCNLEV